MARITLPVAGVRAPPVQSTQQPNSAWKRPVVRPSNRPPASDWPEAGVKSLSRVKMPPPDALIGKTKGGLPSTIDEWNAARPGPGWWRD